MGDGVKRHGVSIGFGLERLGIAALDRPRLFWLLAALVLAITAIGLTRLSFDERLRHIFRGDTEAYATYVAATDDFTDPENETLVLVEGTGLGRPENFQALEDFGFELQLLDGVESIFSLFSLRRRIDDTGRTAPLIENADAGLSEGLAHRIRAHPLAGESLLSGDGEAMIFVVTPATNKAPLALHRRLHADIEATAQTMLGDTGLSVTVSGFPAIRGGIVDALIRDQKVLNAAGAMIGFLLSLLIFRSFTAAILTAGPSVGGGLIVLGAMGFFGFEVTVMSNVVPVLVMIIGYTDAMHLNAAWRSHRRAGLDARQAERAAMADVGQACILTALTTSFAFLSLTISDVAMVHEFGWLGAIGTIAGALVVLSAHALMMPLLGRFWNISRTRRVMPLDWLSIPSAAVARFAIAWARPVSLAGAILFAAAASMHLSVPPEHSVREHLSERDPANAALGRIDEKLAGLFPVSLIVPLDGLAPTSPPALARVRAVHEAVASIPEAGRPVSLWSLADWLGGGVDAGKRLDDLLDDLNPSERARFIGRNSGNALVTVNIREAPTHVTRPVVDRIEAVARAGGDARTVATGVTALTARESERTISNLNLSLAFAVLAGLVLIAIAFRDPRIALVAFLPNALPIVATGTLLYLAGRGMQFTSVIALTVAFGIAVDDTIHYINGFRTARDDDGLAERIVATSRRIGPVLVSTTAIIVVGLVTTLTSGLPTVNLFGRLAMVTLAAALVADLLLLPALMAGPTRTWFKSKHTGKARAARAAPRS